MIERYDSFFFAEIEEYTFAIIELLLRRYPNKALYSFDRIASHLWKDEQVHVVANKKMLSDFGNTLFVVSGKEPSFHPQGGTIQSSLYVMHSLLWNNFLQVLREKERGTDGKFAWGMVPPKFIFSYDVIYMSSMESATMRDLYRAWCRSVPMLPLNSQNFDDVFSREKSLLVYVEDIFPNCNKMSLFELYQKILYDTSSTMIRRVEIVMTEENEVNEKELVRWEKLVAQFDVGYHAVAVKDDEGIFQGCVTSREFQSKFPSVDFSKDARFFAVHIAQQSQMEERIANCMEKSKWNEVPIVDRGKVIGWGAKKACLTHVPLCKLNDIQPVYWEYISDEVAKNFFHKGERILISSRCGPLKGFAERFSPFLDIEVFSSDCLDRYFAGDFDCFICGMDLYPVGRIPKYDARQLYADLLMETVRLYLEKNGVSYYYYDLDGEILDRDYRISHDTEIPSIGTTRLTGSRNNYFAHIDRCSQDTVFLAGRRRTRKSIQGHTLNSIYFFGPCTAVGTSVQKDDETIESYLQEFLDESGKPYQVVNCGALASGPRLLSDINQMYYMMDTIFSHGDIVIHLGMTLYRNETVPHPEKYFSVASLLNRAHNRSLRILRYNGPSAHHLDRTGYHLVAKSIFENLKDFLSTDKEQRTEKKILPFFSQFGSEDMKKTEALRQYLDILSKERVLAKNIGAIVMNCNPFTRGHLYLVKSALEQVEFLYVFVVEEDVSEICFSDRFSMAQLNCKKFSNVKVLPSGKYMISSITFGEYFQKDDLQEQAVYPAKDVELFGSSIAPTLGIRKRFVGEEPLDNVTRQYNMVMKELLPQYGVELVEIPRLQSEEGDFINATEVRRCIRMKNLEKCREYLTEESMRYIEEHLIGKQCQ